MQRRAWQAMAAVAVFTGAALASADPEVVELRYAAPPGCPARARVEAAIVERTPNVRLGAPARRVFAISIEPVEAGFRGTLTVDRVADKELAAQRCDDLATALALVTALAIDPTASAAAPSSSRPAWSFEADLSGMVEAGVGPDALPAAAISGRASWRHLYRLELAVIAGRDSTMQADAEARFTWLAARPGACRVWLRSDVALGACGHVEIGGVRARGERIVNQRDLVRLWLAAGVHGSVQYPAGSRIFGHLQAGMSVPVIRDRYLFAPNVAIHETPHATGWLAVGAGVRFP